MFPLLTTINYPNSSKHKAFKRVYRYLTKTNLSALIIIIIPGDGGAGGGFPVNQKKKGKKKGETIILASQGTF